MHRNAIIESLKAYETPEAAKLFYHVVHESNSNDYSPQQLDAWAPCDPTYQKRIADKLTNQFAIGAKINGTLVGFGSLEEDSAGDCICLDMMFVHPTCQRHGIGAALMEALENEARRKGARRIRAFVSLTARPFFESCGYRVTKSSKAIRNGIELPNWIMEKDLAEKQARASEH